MFEGSLFIGIVLISSIEVSLDGSFLGVTVVNVFVVLSNGGSQSSNGLLPLSKFSFIDLDFVFKFALEVSSSGVGVNFIFLSLLDLGFNSLF